MSQLDTLREEIITKMSAIAMPALRDEALTHTLGVCECMALLARIRDLDPLLCMSMGLLHDCALYLHNCPHQGHAQKSAALAKSLLQAHGYAPAEIEQICTAIAYHSDKGQRHDAYSEALKDADILERWLREKDAPLSDARRIRLIALCRQLQLHP